MRSPQTLSAWIGLVAAAMLSTTSQGTPSFQEVSDLVRSNLVGTSPEQLNRLAVEGFLSELSPRVTLLDESSEAAGDALPAGVLQVEVYRDRVGYIRLGQLQEPTGEQVRERYDELTSSNQLSGLVLDLRLAGGDDYPAAVAVADLFLTEESPLMNWGEGLKRSQPKDEAITIPVAVLINARTGGTAEALAAVLRQTGVALLIGNPTSGTAGVRETFPLSDGGALRITVSAVQLGDAQSITADGIQPDVAVAIDLDDEIKLMNARQSDPLDGAGDDEEAWLGPTRNRMNEADLVRHWRGEMLTADDFQRDPVDNGPASRDPALLRALDLMEGLSILRSWER